MSERNDQPQVWRCKACGTLFERGVAADAENQPRCPQCGLWEAIPVVDQTGEFVIRRSTKFR